jgi:hypothetical protein
VVGAIGERTRLIHAATYYQQLDPEQVQIRSNKAEVERRIAVLVQRKRAEIDQSNQLEFTSFAKQGAAAQDMTSARTDPADLNRTIQMRLDVVDNGDGPLSRLVAAPSRAGSGRHIKCDGVEERLSNIEQHLNVQYATPIPLDIYERLKVLEEKIMRLERDHPTWAAIHFQQPGRTVSNMIDIYA